LRAPNREQSQDAAGHRLMFLDIVLIDVQTGVHKQIDQRRRIGWAPHREIQHSETRMTRLRFVGDEDNHETGPVLLRERKERPHTSLNLDC
jgi:hypothetical protein